METLRKLILCLPLAFGCAHGVPMVQVQAAEVAASAIDTAADVLEQVCSIARARDIQASGGDVMRYVRSCDQAFAAHAVARQAHEDWVFMMAVVHAGKKFDVLRAAALVRQLVASYQALEALVTSLGGDVPDLPSVLRSLL